MEGNLDVGDSDRRLAIHYEWVSIGWACVDRLTSELSSFAFMATKQEDGARVLAEPDSKYARVARFLTDSPSDVLNADSFWRDLWWKLNAKGNAYALIHRNRRGDPVNLEPVVRVNPPVPYASIPIRPPTYRFYEYPHREFQSEDVLALHGPGFMARRQMSPSLFLVAAQNLGYLNIALERMTEQLDDPSMVMSIEEPEDPQSGAARAALARKAMETARRRRTDPVLLNAKSYWRQMRDGGGTESQVEKLRWEAEEVCRVWGVPPRSVSVMTTGMRTEASLVGQMADLKQMGLDPRNRILSSEISAKLLTPRDRAMGCCIELDMDSQLRGTLNERAEAVVSLCGAGLWTINEGRALTGKEPRPEGDELKDPMMMGGPDGGAKMDRESPSPPGSQRKSSNNPKKTA